MTEVETRLIDGYNKRTLADWIPQLQQLIAPGTSVLDVGCGPGAITADVARLVAPGKTVGIDPGEARIAVAQQMAEQNQQTNLSFTVGDSHQLGLDDDSFDVAYSNTVLHSLIDPVLALKEQKRVAKTGGYVVAAGVRDWGFGSRYPPCPKLDRLERARVEYFRTEQEKYFQGSRAAVRSDRQMPECAYFDLYAGRKCAEWFSLAGLSELRMEATVFRLDHQGAEHMETGGLELLPRIGDRETPWAEVAPELIDGGFIDSASIEAAAVEAAEWYQRPDAFNLWAYLYVQGTA